MTHTNAAVKPDQCQWISFRVSTEERALLDSFARYSGSRRAEFIRRAVLFDPIPSRMDAEMVRELRRLGAMLKHLYPRDSNWAAQEKERYWTVMNSDHRARNEAAGYDQSEGMIPPSRASACRRPLVRCSAAAWADREVEGGQEKGYLDGNLWEMIQMEVRWRI